MEVLAVTVAQKKEARTMHCVENSIFNGGWV